MPRRRWTAAEKAEVVLESLTMSIPISELCREYQISSSQFYTWRERFIQVGKSGLGGARSTREEELEKEHEQLKGVIGELTLANAVLKNARSSLEERREAVKEMSKEGIATAHACDYAGIPRSTYYSITTGLDNARRRASIPWSLPWPESQRSAIPRMAIDVLLRWSLKTLRDQSIGRRCDACIMAELNLLQEPPKRRPHLTHSREPQTAAAPNRSCLAGRHDQSVVQCG